MAMIVGAAPAPPWARRPLVPLMLATDIGFLVYWAVTAFHLLPGAWLFKDYEDPRMQAWNWSFLALDLVVSGTGIGAAVMLARRHPGAAAVAVMSLTATAASGLMALSFWTIRRDFDPAWWAPNLFLAVYPLFFARRFLGSK